MRVTEERALFAEPSAESEAVLLKRLDALVHPRRDPAKYSLPSAQFL